SVLQIDTVLGVAESLNLGARLTSNLALGACRASNRAEAQCQDAGGKFGHSFFLLGLTITLPDRRRALHASASDVLDGGATFAPTAQERWKYRRRWRAPRRCARRRKRRAPSPL